MYLCEDNNHLWYKWRHRTTNPLLPKLMIMKKAKEIFRKLILNTVYIISSCCHTSHVVLYYTYLFMLFHVVIHFFSCCFMLSYMSFHVFSCCHIYFFMLFYVIIHISSCCFMLSHTSLHVVSKVKQNQENIVLLKYQNVSASANSGNYLCEVYNF